MDYKKLVQIRFKYFEGNCNVPSSCRASQLYVLMILKFLSVETPKTMNFPFLQNGKLMVSRCPKIKQIGVQYVLHLKLNISCISPYC